MIPKTGIYKITCTANDKYYYGSAEDFKARWYSHKRELRKNIHSNHHMQSVWNKHSESSFLFEIECECSLEDLLPLEQAYLDEYCGKPNCMNIARYVGSYTGNRLVRILNNSPKKTYDTLRASHEVVELLRAFCYDKGYTLSGIVDIALIAYISGSILHTETKVVL